MDRIKNKYEIILGFVTLIISFSAFKDELAKVELNLGYYIFNLSQYLLFIVICFAICLYLYVSEIIARDTKIGKWKIFDYLVRFAYFLFVFMLLTPILIALNILIVKITYLLIDNVKELESRIGYMISGALGALTASLSKSWSKILLENRKKKEEQEIEEQEIKDLDQATKLFKDQYYAHSILESFKVLELHLYRIIISRNFRVQRYQFEEIVRIALKEKIIQKSDIESINEIREMRNVVAHSDAELTKDKAESALIFVRKLLSSDYKK